MHFHEFLDPQIQLQHTSKWHGIKKNWRHRKYPENKQFDCLTLKKWWLEGRQAFPIFQDIRENFPQENPLKDAKPETSETVEPAGDAVSWECCKFLKAGGGIPFQKSLEVNHHFKKMVFRKTNLFKNDGQGLPGFSYTPKKRNGSNYRQILVMRLAFCI